MDYQTIKCLRICLQLLITGCANVCVSWCIGQPALGWTLLCLAVWLSNNAARHQATQHWAQANQHVNLGPTCGPRLTTCRPRPNMWAQANQRVNLGPTCGPKVYLWCVWPQLCGRTSMLWKMLTFSWLELISSTAYRQKRFLTRNPMVYELLRVDSRLCVCVQHVLGCVVSALHLSGLYCSCWLIYITYYIPLSRLHKVTSM